MINEGLRVVIGPGVKDRTVDEKNQCHKGDKKTGVQDCQYPRESLTAENYDANWHTQNSGRHIKVYWKKYDKYFIGKIGRFNKKTGTCLVWYEDKSRAPHRLADWDFEFVDNYQSNCKKKNRKQKKKRKVKIGKHTKKRKRDTSIKKVKRKRKIGDD